MFVGLSLGYPDCKGIYKRIDFLYIWMVSNHFVHDQKVCTYMYVLLFLGISLLCSRIVILVCVTFTEYPNMLPDDIVFNSMLRWQFRNLVQSIYGRICVYTGSIYMLHHPINYNTIVQDLWQERTKGFEIEAPCRTSLVYQVLLTVQYGSCIICYDIDGLVDDIRNYSALAMELCLSCTNPSIWQPCLCGVFLCQSLK